MEPMLQLRHHATAALNNDIGDPFDNSALARLEDVSPAARTQPINRRVRWPGWWGRPKQPRTCRRQS